MWQAAPRIACEPCEQPVDLSRLPAERRPGCRCLQSADAVRGGAGPLPPEQLAPRVIIPQNDYIMTDMMADVIKHGTGGARWRSSRADIAGKTGTTNAVRRTPGSTASHRTWWPPCGWAIDQERPLGEGEEGARTALPIWIHFMREALQGVPGERRPMPDGIVTLRVSPQTGALVSAENPDGISEIFMADHLPGGRRPRLHGAERRGGPAGQAAGEPIF